MHRYPRLLRSNWLPLTQSALLVVQLNQAELREPLSEECPLHPTVKYQITTLLSGLPALPPIHP
jgi:hypothetical protein